MNADIHDEITQVKGSFEKTGKISHDQAMKKAEQEYKKYQENTNSPVEQAYMETIKDAGQEAKSGLRKI